MTPMTNETVKHAVEFLSWPLVLLIAAVLMYLTKVFAKYLHSKIALVEDEKKRAILNQLVDLAEQKVLMVEQTVISDLKRSVAEGTVDKKDLPKMLAAAKSSAVEAVKRDAAAMGVWEDATKSMGDANALLNFLSDTVESHVAKLPSSGVKDSLPYEGMKMVEQGPDPVKTSEG